MSLCIVLFWYTFVVISWIFWVLFMVAFTFNNKNRDTWLRGQICLFLALLFIIWFNRFNFFTHSTFYNIIWVTFITFILLKYVSTFESVLFWYISV